MSFASSSSASAASSKRTRPASGSESASSKRNPSTKKKKKQPFQNSPFPNFGSYMTEKNRKLRSQFEASIESGNGSGVFSGVSIFVDGFTIPSSQELKEYMLKHGGRFENYFSRHRVTHIICSNLPDSKMKNFRAFSRGLPVVKPDWVIDCLAANKLLNCVPYQLHELAKASGKQQKLSAFFTPKDKSSSNDAEIAQCAKLEADEGTEQEILPEEGKLSSYKIEDMEESSCIGNDSRRDEEEVANLKFADLEDEDSLLDASEASPCRLSNMASGSCNDDNDLKKASNSKSQGPQNHLHSTLRDPNFVENYFKNSRLHFIGTWRNRYRKRFSNALSGNRLPDTDVSASVSLQAFVMHVDMDCFFVSVVIRKYPDLLNTPVAVCHSDNPKGTAEISSANYPARDYGVRAGMFVRDAKACCPQLTVVPYDFEAYEEVADQFYSILHKYCNLVQAVSCDEAFLDVTECANNDPEHLAAVIRKEIADTTQCTASAGIAKNMLLARLATRSAKPNGQCFIPSEKVDEFLKDLPLKALPGIGNTLGERLKRRQIHTCGQLRMFSKDSLQKDFGEKTGDMLWNYCRGVDNRTVDGIQEMKSVGADVNWGVRFNDTSECQRFLMNLCKEVAFRLQECGAEGRTITLKVKKRRKGAQEPTKFMGHGDCESMSRSTTLSVATDSATLLQRITKQIFLSLHIDVKDVRGVGLQISKLENIEQGGRGRGQNTLESWLSSIKTGTHGKSPTSYVNFDDSEPVDTERKLQQVCLGVQHGDGRISGNFNEALAAGPSHREASTRSNANRISVLPPLSELDVDVIKNLPPEIYSEMNNLYNGRLSDLMKAYEEKDGKPKNKLSTIYPPEDKGLSSSSIKLGRNSEANTTAGKTGAVESYSNTRDKGKQPFSASPCTQNLPNHSEMGQTSFKDPTAASSKNSISRVAQYSEKSKDELWLGIPPNWVKMFKTSTCLILNVIAELYDKSGMKNKLSGILRSAFSFCPLNFDMDGEAQEDALSSFCELILQYTDLRIASDLEELYTCLRLLKRFASTSKFLLEVYNIVLPRLQASVNEYYGGHFQLSP